MNAAVTWPSDVHIPQRSPIASLLMMAAQASDRSHRGVRIDARVRDHLHRMLALAFSQLKDRSARSERSRQDAQFAACVALVEARLEQFEDLYARLGDNASRVCLLALLRARMGIGPWVAHQARQVEHQQRQLASALVERETRKPWRPYLNRYCLAGVGGQLVLQSEEQTLLWTLLREAYAYEHDGVTIRAQPGDTVIDGGSRHGEAAVYFADRVRPSGRVYAVELEAGNAELTGENLVLNPQMRDSVTVIKRALSNRTGDAVQYRPHGPATCEVRVDQWGALTAETPTVTIDDLVDELDLERVDLIKLDLGGWERRALAGAQRTLSRFRPSLVVSVAHGLEDLAALPSELDHLAAGYELFLSDMSLDGAHPVLFARPYARRLPA